MDKRQLIRIIMPIFIVILIAGIWVFKNSNPGSADSVTPNNSEDFALETEAIDLDALTAYGLPIIIDFGSDSCIPCKEMAPVLETMCCSTGLCGVGVDPELLRISTVLASLKKNGIQVERYNLTNAPQEFIKNAEVNQLISKGVDVLPVIVLDGKVVITKRYPTNDEFIFMCRLWHLCSAAGFKHKLHFLPNCDVLYRYFLAGFLCV